MFYQARIAFASALVIAAIAPLAGAATVTVTPFVTRYFANDTALANGTPSSWDRFDPPAGVYEIAFTVKTVLSPADIANGYTSLENVFFDINQGATPLPDGLTGDPLYGEKIYDLNLRENPAGTRFSYQDPVTGQTTNADAGSGTKPE